MLFFTVAILLCAVQNQGITLIAHTTFSPTQVYLNSTVMCPPGVTIEAVTLVT